MTSRRERERRKWKEEEESFIFQRAKRSPNSIRRSNLSLDFSLASWNGIEQKKKKEKSKKGWKIILQRLRRAKKVQKKAKARSKKKTKKIFFFFLGNDRSIDHLAIPVIDVISASSRFPDFAKSCLLGIFFVSQLFFFFALSCREENL